MNSSTQIKPISYVKANVKASANAATKLLNLTINRDVLVITQNREATAVMQDIASYEADQQPLALLKILALGNQQIEQEKVFRAVNAITRIRAKQRASSD